MASTVSLEGIKKAVYYPFQGRKWGLKLLVGSALSFAGFILPVIPVIPVFGYIGRIMQQIIVKDEEPQLPEWQDWGGLFLGGIKLLGAAIVYFLPSLIVTIGGYAVFMLLDFSLVFSTSAVNYSSNSFPAPLILSILGMFAGMIVMMLGMVLVFLTVIIIPPALGNLIAKDDFGAAFRFREWWPVLKANLSGYILAVAISLGIFYLLYILALVFYATIILCFLLPFLFALISFLSSMLALGLFAIAYRDGLNKLPQVV